MDELQGRRFLIWGGGGHGKVLADLIRAVQGTVVGYIDADAAKLDTVVEPGGARVVLLQQDFTAVLADGSFPDGSDALALAVGRNEVRLDCLRQAGDSWAPPLIHPSAVVSPSAQVGRGSVVFPGAVVNAAARIGDAVIINSGAIVEHDCKIGDGAHISPGAVLAGGVQVGERSWVGAGATVIPGVRIGDGVIVGAGAAVIRDVEGGLKMVGVPARLID